MALPGIVKRLDTIRRKDQIQVEGAVFELYENLSATDFLSLVPGQLEAEILKREQEPLAVGRILFNEQVCVLGCIRITQQDSPGFSDEQIPYRMQL